MLTNIESRYEFQDGVAYAVGDQYHLTADSEIKLYIPSIMANIQRSITSEVMVETVPHASEIFVNTDDSMPTISNYLESCNYLTTKCSKSMVDSDRGYFDVEAGDELFVSSNVGAILNLIAEWR